MFKVKFVLVALLLVIACPRGVTTAQDSSKYYSVTHPSEFPIDWGAFYRKADQDSAAVRKAYPHYLDIPYGKDNPKQKLDIYLPLTKPSNAPVFVYVHGGGFFEGDRSDYGYIVPPFAKHGIVTVVLSYRLVTQGFHYPAATEDVENALAWTYHNIKSYGGDPNRIYIAGHSAGAQLVGFIGVTTDWLSRRSLPLDLIKGCVPISGGFDARKNKITDRSYISDPKQLAEASAIVHIQRTPRIIVAAGGKETAAIQHAKEFVAKVREKGGVADVVVADDMRHDQIALSLADENSMLFRAILNMIEEPADGSKGL